ncbi:MAG TPA: hypothetical protein VND65_05785, partial [Candidatus Binatia bacterium]|nr:hypothetical protein [Candidatus Binatia bacterium]
CQLGTQFDEHLKSDLRVYRRYYPSAANATFTSMAEVRGALAHKYDILHLFCAVEGGGAISDASGDRITGADLLSSAASNNLKLLWIGNDNPQSAYEAGFQTKGLKINTVFTLRRLGSNTSLFLDNLLGKMTSGETIAKAWEAAQPSGKSVQPDVPHTISYLGRGSVILK